MTEWVAADRSRSRAVLIGTSEYTELPSIRAVANSLDRMYRLLTGPLCGWPAEQVTVVADKRRPGSLPDQLIELYSQAGDVALFYYVGHGQIDDEDRLCLALVESRLQPERRATSSLTFDAVRRALRVSGATTKIVILDCCFAGQAVHGPHTLAGPEVDVTALTSATGAYTLAATGPYSTAWFEGEHDAATPQTHFTRHLTELVERGIPGKATGLTLDQIYFRLREDLITAGKPAPSRSSRDLGDRFVFARNRATEGSIGTPDWAMAQPDISTPAPTNAQERARLYAELIDHFVAELTAPDVGDVVRWQAADQLIKMREGIGFEYYAAITEDREDKHVVRWRAADKLIEAGDERGLDYYAAVAAGLEDPYLPAWAAADKLIESGDARGTAYYTGVLADPASSSADRRRAAERLAELNG